MKKPIFKKIFLICSRKPDFMSFWNGPTTFESDLVQHPMTAEHTLHLQTSLINSLQHSTSPFFTKHSNIMYFLVPNCGLLYLKDVLCFPQSFSYKMCDRRGGAVGYSALPASGRFGPWIQDATDISYKNS